MKFICFLLFALLLSSCSKDDSCIDQITGNYGGFVSAIGVFPCELTIAKAPSGGYDLVMTDYFIAPSGATYTGTLSGDCKTISIPQQTSLIQGSVSFTISGTLNIDNGTLTGNCNVKIIYDVTQSYYLVKK